MSLVRYAREAPAVQYGDRAKSARTEAQAVLGNIIGPIPRYLFSALSDDELAMEIKQRWIAKRIDQSARTLLDMRLLGWLYPERVQDHWQNMWTGKSIKKLMHNGDQGLSVGMVNMVKPIVMGLTGIFAGNKPMAYDLDVLPFDPLSDSDLLSSSITTKFMGRWQRHQEYAGTYLDGVVDMVSIGRWAKYTYTDETTRHTVSENLWPGHCAFFWQSNQRTLEQVIVAKYLTVGEAVAMWPDKRAQIEAAMKPPVTRTSAGAARLSDENGWLRYTNVTVLQCWYRTEDPTKIGLTSTLIGPSAQDTRQMATVLLSNSDDTKYTDIPVRVTCLFKTPTRPPDESQGILYEIAPLQTELNEVYSALRDMLWRAFYPRFAAKGFTYRNGPRLIGRSSVLALPRADQDIKKIEDALNTQGPDNFVNWLEDRMVILGMMNRNFMGIAPPSETSGDAIDASINATIARLEPTRTNIELNEIHMYKQVNDQQRMFGVFDLPDGAGTMKMSDVLSAQPDITIRWVDTFRNGIKQKQMAIAGVKSGMISSDTGRHMWGVSNLADEDRKIKREKQDALMRPADVSQTASAIIALANARRITAMGNIAPPNIRFTLRGNLDPVETANLARNYGIPDQTGAPPGPGGPGTPMSDAAARYAPPAAAPSGGGTLTQLLARMRQGQQAPAAAATPSFENNNQPGGVTGGAGAMAGDVANPINANPSGGQ